MLDIPETWALACAIVGTFTSLWAVWRTLRKLHLIRNLRDPDTEVLKQKGYFRLVRHLLNLVAQLALLYIAGLAIWAFPPTETVQAATTRATTGVVSLILAVKVIVDTFQELLSEWNGQERRRR